MCEPPDDEHELPPDDAEQGDGNDDFKFPPGHRDENIPNGEELKRASIEALDREMAFVILHRETAPQQIIARLCKLADVARAACQIPGEHQAKAIKLGLELKMWYWLAADKMDDWIRLIMPMLETALDMEDEELISRVYQALSTYKHIQEDRPEVAPRILQIAEEYATESKRADLQLLIRADLFNTRILGMSFEEARAEAENLLMEARRIKYNLVQGSVYNSLALTCGTRHLYAESFTYAQQALVFFVPLNAMSLAGASVMAMLSSFNQSGAFLPDYRSQLMTYLERLSVQTANPFLQAHIAFFQGRASYDQGQYDAARGFILAALRKYRMTRFPSSIYRATHMLGMVQAKRRQWKAAEKYLRAAHDFYKLAGEAAYAVQAYYALAFIPFEQEDWQRARTLLVETLEMAEQLPEEKVRVMFVESIKQDIEEVDRHLAEAVSR